MIERMLTTPNMPTSRGAGRSRRRSALRLAALGLALVLGSAGGAQAAPTPPEKPVPLSGGAPTKAWDECAQRCFSGFMKNVGQCSAQFCSQFLFFVWCDNDQMAQCQANAQEVFDLCLESCNA